MSEQCIDWPTKFYGQMYCRIKNVNNKNALLRNGERGGMLVFDYNPGKEVNKQNAERKRERERKGEQEDKGKREGDRQKDKQRESERERTKWTRVKVRERKRRTSKRRRFLKLSA